jgi:hypothetical protein
MEKTMQGMEMTILAKLDLGDWQELFSEKICSDKIVRRDI